MYEASAELDAPHLGVNPCCTKALFSNARYCGIISKDYGRNLYE